jgi:outer membrane protein assembly factor BamD (BamD/ComL family)
VSKDSRSDEALDGYLLMASIHEIRGEREDAIAAYLDISSRYPASPRAPEALVRMADTMLQSRRRGKDEEALKIYAGVVERYPSSSWTPRALMAKGAIEERLRLYQRDDVLAGTVPSALVTYRHLVEEYVGSAEREAALWKLSQLYERVKRFDLAADALAALGGDYPSSRHDGWFAAAEMYEKRLKEPSNARSAYARVPTSSSKFEEAQKRLARR